MNRILPAAALLLFAAYCLLPGCSGQSDHPLTYPVRGRVTYQGKPVAGATVAFLAPGAPRIAVGTTDDDGMFQLTTYQPNDGAILGTHVVTIRKMSTELQTTPAVGTTSDESIDPAVIERAMEQEARAAMNARSLLPVKYSDRRTSNLSKEVVEGENNFQIELVD